MRALTVHQPHAWAIVRGIKRIENRSRSTLYRGPLAIHAGLSRESLGDRDDWDDAVMVGLPDWRDLPFGAVVGVVDLIDCVAVEAAERLHPDQYEFASGPWCWVLANPRPLSRPLPCPGSLGLWRLPANVLAAVAAASGTRCELAGPR